ncbi:MAG: haloalkane dehalogenase [Acidimicrobiales bacterium]
MRAPDDRRRAAGMDKRTVEVLGHHMAYVEEGSGGAIVLLHGNPTSSFLWRSVIPHLVTLGRCIAPDLIGMGDSDKLADSGPGSYRFVEHRRYLDAFLDAVEVTGPVTLVLHDWGSALGFDWAARHPDAVTAIAYMEAIVCPVTWDDWPDAARGIFQAFRSPAGEEMLLERNLFVEAVLPASIQRQLTEDEMAEYRRPFARSGEGRRPTLTWPREIPVDGEPADVVEIVERYGAWLAASTHVRKLFVNAEPGAILTGRQRQLCRSWPNQTEVTVPGIHFIQEDSGDQIGAAIASWLDA